MTSPPPAPEDLPRFAEEGDSDPFGQCEALLQDAAGLAFQLANELATLANERSTCLMLPSPGAWRSDPVLVPWRSVAGAAGGPALPAPAPSRSYAGLDDRGQPVQELLQRAVVALAALGPDDALDRVTELMEPLGYLALGREHTKDKLDRFPEDRRQYYFSVGKIMGQIHNLQIIHGDVHPGNFLYDPRVSSAVICDPPPFAPLGRPLTARERAGDLGMLKLTVQFLMWEVVKLGYRSEAPKDAPAVFELL